MKQRSTGAPASRFNKLFFLAAIALAAFGIPSQARAIGYEQIHSFGFPELMGELPMTPPIRASDGALYGTTSAGGRFSRGVIYRLDSDGSQYRAILHMGSTGNDAKTPIGEVMEGSDGALYGASYWGGNNDIGTVFKANKDGSGYSVLFHFNGANGRNPIGKLTEDGNGFLYGTTLRGGVNNLGVLFRLQKNDTGFQLLHQFGGGETLSEGWRVSRNRWQNLWHHRARRLRKRRSPLSPELRRNWL